MLAHLILAVLWRQTIHTPYAGNEPLSITSIEAPPSVAAFEVEEAVVAAHGTFDNPFDPDDVALDAYVKDPTGTITRVPGFFYRAFARKLDKGTEILNATGSPEWRVRICPTLTGPYSVSIHFKDRSGEVEKSFDFNATTRGNPGFVGVSQEDRHYFAYASPPSASAAGFFPLGANICWAGPGGTYDYDRWLPKFSDQGCNYFRVWLAPFWTTFALEKPGRPYDGAGMGQFDLADAWRLDYVLRLADKDGMYAMLCIDSYNELRDRDGYPAWEQTPQNARNGGPLQLMSDFWTNPQMDRFYRNKLRYLVARYSAFRNVFSWEFWNEVDGIRDYNPDPVRGWHQRMGAALRAMDPYHHMITTSFGNSMGDRSIDMLPELDYSQTHLYNPNLTGGVSYQQQRKSDWGKPHYVGEVGADASGPRAKEDTLGYQVHDPIWASISTGASGGAMPWWWDSLIEPNDLYHLFGAAKAFVDGIDFPSEAFRQVDSKLSYADPHTVAPPGDLLLDSGAVSWDPDPANQPQAISIRNGHLDGPMPSGLLHGVRNHTDLHNPLTVTIQEAKPSTLEISIQEVSTYGGATLDVTVDGSTAVSKTFDTGEDNKQPENGHKYDGIISVPLPAGTHVIKVEDKGNDWIRVAYRFVGVVPRTHPPLSPWTLVGNDVAVIWVRQSGQNWHSLVVEKRIPPVVPPTVLHVPGLASGAWKAEVWDTWTGKLVARSVVSVGLDGTAAVNLPAIPLDVAVKLIKTPAGTQR